MMQLGTATNPLRVAIIGAGPSGFYVAEHLFNQTQLVIDIDMIERLPTPYGLVRGGVAPDHQKIKAVTATYDKIAAQARFRYYGNVEFGKHVSLDDLRELYHQIVFTTGAQTDRRMDIPGEDLQGSHAATAFVAWYNGHPDFRHQQFDFSHPRAVVVGVGNVAVDVARILCRTPEELARTDIADYALEALRHSRIKEVYMLGRRGPAQAAFTNPELKELGELAGADVFVPPQEAALDEFSRTALEKNPDRATVRKVEMLQGYTLRKDSGKPRQLVLRFLVSPVELMGNDAGQVVALRLVKNKLYPTEAGTLRPKPTGEYEELPVGLVFRSVGYQGIPLPGLPFDDRWGVILNQQGRVLDPHTLQPLPGLYTAGWIKRGPTGVIGTNKPDALETVKCMVEDVAQARLLSPPYASAEAADKRLREHQPLCVSYADWQHLNAIEIARGKAAQRPRIKFTCVEDMLAALRQTAPV
jgi:ferredoxin/flavodoxin---NADP+ reductase